MTTILNLQANHCISFVINTEFTMSPRPQITLPPTS